MVNMFEGKINKVLYVAGPGRSGSTLLEMLLGQMDGFYPIGELRFIWKRAFGQNQLCGCGKPFIDCLFWKEVIKEAFGGFQNIDHVRLEGMRRPAERLISSGILTTNTPSNTLAPYQEYFDSYRKIYQAILKVTECEFIIDSSKNVANGFILAAIPEVDLYTIHLIRDSRAVAYSWQREKVRPEIPWEQKFMSQRGILKSASRWNSRNRSAQKLKQRSQQSALLRYEDLAHNPKECLSKLITDLGIEPYSLDFLNGASAQIKTLHTVSGNPVRFMREEIKIRPDLQWQNDMATHQKWMVTILTWPLLMKYGYFKNGRSKRKEV